MSLELDATGYSSYKEKPNSKCSLTKRTYTVWVNKP